MTVHTDTVFGRRTTAVSCHHGVSREALEARSRRTVPLLLALCAALPAARTLAGPEGAAEPPAYRLEVRAPSHVGLFHWLDSIAGTSNGKTIILYRNEYERLFKKASAEDLAQIRAFRDVRARHAQVRQRGAWVWGFGYPRLGLAAMLGVFMEEDSEEAALVRLAPQLQVRDMASLRRALDHFRPRYMTIWEDARQLKRFSAEFDRPEFRRSVEEFLAIVARFMGVNTAGASTARLNVVPVPGGGGTHAQAVGRNLLMEIRPGDTPSDMVDVIVHENVHVMWEMIPDRRLRSLEEAAGNAAPRGDRLWRLMHEALPTALGQGVGQARFHPVKFSRDEAWYHVADVDRVAKSIYPILERSIAEGRILDEALMAELVRAGR